MRNNEGRARPLKAETACAAVDVGSANQVRLSCCRTREVRATEVGQVVLRLNQERSINEPSLGSVQLRRRHFKKRARRNLSPVVSIADRGRHGLKPNLGRFSKGRKGKQQ